ncbi:MAG: hypothetical protein COC09_07455 [Gammaproteobacteria bacterium]|nr:MAG: hypothetical protein COC09_07455 [Gammaproteobacteria bacterium]
MAKREGLLTPGAALNPSLHYDSTAIRTTQTAYPSIKTSNRHYWFIKMRANGLFLIDAKLVDAKKEDYSLCSPCGPAL